MQNIQDFANILLPLSRFLSHFAVYPFKAMCHVSQDSKTGRVKQLVQVT